MKKEEKLIDILFKVSELKMSVGIAQRKILQLFGFNTDINNSVFKGNLNKKKKTKKNNYLTRKVWSMV